MPMKLLSAEAFRDAAKDGAEPDATVFRFATTEPQDVDGAVRTKRFVFSDATVDHAGDVIDPKGWDLAIFKRNPVALFSHMSWEPPIGRASNVAVQAGKLVGDIEFADADTYQFADTIFRLVDGGFMSAVSVGFKPKEWAFTSDKDRPYGIDFKKQTLLEISVCPVPCNPNALTEARSAGIDTAPLQEWAEKVLDNGDTVFLPKKELETLRGQAAGNEAPRYYIQTATSVSAEAGERIRDAVKRWQDDPSEVLILGPDVTLRTIADVVADPTVGTGVHDDDDTEVDLDELVDAIKSLDEAGDLDAEKVRAQLEKAFTALKAGRRVSAATKAKLQEAMGHHDAMGKCIKDVMEDEEADDDFGDPDNQPPGTVVTESDEQLSPEERRIKEVAALRETIPAID